VETEVALSLRDRKAKFYSAAKPQNHPGCFRAAEMMTEVVAKKQRIHP
jgi:hypothetical protein